MTSASGCGGYALLSLEMELSCDLLLPELKNMSTKADKFGTHNNVGAWVYILITQEILSTIHVKVKSVCAYKLQNNWHEILRKDAPT